MQSPDIWDEWNISTHWYSHMTVAQYRSPWNHSIAAFCYFGSRMERWFKFIWSISGCDNLLHWLASQHAEPLVLKTFAWGQKWLTTRAWCTELTRQCRRQTSEPKKPARTLRRGCQPVCGGQPGTLATAASLCCLLQCMWFRCLLSRCTHHVIYADIHVDIST